jgi:hypothetical protein
LPTLKLLQKLHAGKLKAAMLKQRLVASWRLLGKRPFGHPKFVLGQAEE